MPLSDVGLQAMIAEIAPGATARKPRPIGGGLASETFAVDTTAGDLVIKLFRPHRSAEAPLEWERLRFARRADGVPVPEPVALDSEGRWFGPPALVMTRRPGRADVTPADLDGWLRQLGQVLAAIHATDTAGASGALLGDPPLGHWGIGDWERLDPEPSALVERVIAAIHRYCLTPDEDPVLVHGDFHPGNIVWKDGTLTGVVDWAAARLGSRGFELAYCRAGIALLFGLPGMRRLTQHYLDIAGRTPPDLPVFDLMCGLVARRFGASHWLGSYRHQGCTDSPRQFAARMPPFLHQALAELGA